jgi:phosphatidylglycerophosphatase A
MRRAQLLAATGLGVGYAPVVPGTFGSALGVLLYVGLAWSGGWIAVLSGLGVVTALGFWSAGAAERHFGRRDPRQVVVDEIAGQILAMLLVPMTPATLAAGFIVFRVFDILKPYPVRSMESLPGGSGIMADDLVAGLYANLVLQLLVRLAPATLGIG